MQSKIIDIVIPFSGFHLPIYSYGFMLALGFMAALWIASFRAQKEGIKPQLIMDLGFVALLAGIVGARLAYVVEFHGEFSWRLFRITDGGWSIPAGLLGASIGATAAYYFAAGKRRPDRLVLACAVIAAVAASRLVYVGFHADDYPGALDLFKVYRGGLSFYGGLIMASVFAVWFIRKHNQSLPLIADIAAPSVALGLAFGRVGCFLNGCCYGKITSLPLGVRFPGNGQGVTPAWAHHHDMGLISFADPYSLPVHPTQIYHALTVLVIFGILIAAYPSRRRHGQIFLLFGALYSALRFPIEFLRDDMDTFLLGLTAYQLLAVPVFLVCSFLYVRILSAPRAADQPSF